MKSFGRKCLILFGAVVLLASNITMNVYAVTKARIVIESYSLESGIIYGGEETVLTMTVKNASTTNRATNILITGVGQDNLVYPAYGYSNQLYIDSLEPGESTEVSLKIRSMDIVRWDSICYDLNIMFSDETYGDNYLTAILQLPVSREGDLVVTDCSAPETAYQNAKTRVSASFFNDGYEDIYNISMHVKGVDGTNEVDGPVVDALLPEESSFVETYISFEKMGAQMVSVYFTYEDEQGKAFTTEDETFQITVKEPRSAEAGNETPRYERTDAEVEMEPILPTETLALEIVLLVIICILILWIVISLRSKRRK